MSDKAIVRAEEPEDGEKRAQALREAGALALRNTRPGAQPSDADIDRYNELADRHGLTEEEVRGEMRRRQNPFSTLAAPFGQSAGQIVQASAPLPIGVRSMRTAVEDFMEARDKRENWIRAEEERRKVKQEELIDPLVAGLRPALDFLRDVTKGRHYALDYDVVPVSTWGAEDSNGRPRPDYDSSYSGYTSICIKMHADNWREDIWSQPIFELNIKLTPPKEPHYDNSCEGYNNPHIRLSSTGHTREHFGPVFEHPGYKRPDTTGEETMGILMRALLRMRIITLDDLEGASAPRQLLPGADGAAPALPAGKKHLPEPPAPGRRLAGKP